MFLVDDNQTERIDGGEDCGARADDDACPALANLVPFVMAFSGGEIAVEDSDQGFQAARSEARLEAFDRLRRERNLGHEHDRAFALLEGVCDGLEIDFGFAAAGDAVDEKGAGGRGSGGALGCWGAGGRR